MDQKKIRVCEIIECGGNGGAGAVVADICQSLDLERFEIILIYNVRPGSRAEDYENLFPASVKKIRVLNFVREIRPWADGRAFFEVLRILFREKPDVLHCHSSKAGFIGRLAAFWARSPRVYYSPHGYGFMRQDVSLFTRSLYWILEWGVSWIGEIAAVSPSEALAAKKLSWGKAVQLLNNPVQPELLEMKNDSGVGDGALEILSVGRLTPQKNPEAFVRLAAALAPEFPNARFAWIGGGELEDELKRLAQQISAPVEWLGWRSHEEVISRLLVSSFMIQSSLWEGLPLTVLEAQALGKPVVAMDIPGNNDVVENEKTGFLVSGFSDLCQKARVLLLDRNLRERMGLAARQRARNHFSKAVWTAQLESLYGNRIALAPKNAPEKGSGIT